MCARPGVSTPSRTCTTGDAGDQERHDRHPDERAGDQREGRVDRRDHQRRHRSRDGRADDDPQRRAEPLAVVGGGTAADTAHCLLHYPRCVAETVDVLIIAPDVPAYAHPGDAGADLVSTEALRLEPGQRALVGTGVRIALPDGYVAFVVPRSGLATKHGITIVNSPGTVDAGYRGEIKVTLLNTDADEAYDIGVGDRIAQLIVMPVSRADFIPVETAARQRPRRRRIRLDRLPDERSAAHDRRDPHGRRPAPDPPRRPRDGRALRRVRGEPRPPLHRPRRHQDPAARGTEPAARGRGADQAHRRGRPRLRRTPRCRCSRSRRPARRGCGRRRASRSGRRSVSRADASRSARARSGPSSSPRCPSPRVPDGAAGKRLARFVGVDGPRWFLRGVIGGAATADVDAAAQVEDLFRSIVVVRGGTPMPPRDLIPLRMPATPGVA